MAVTHQPPKIQIEGKDRVAAAQEALGKQKRLDVRLECATTGERFDVVDVQTHAASGEMTVTIDELGLTRDRFDAGVNLHVNLGMEAVLFEGVAVNTFRIEADPPYLQLAKPETVYVTNKRQATRLRLVRGMRALVQLQVYADRNPLDARLMNLSLGGCGIEVELETGMLLEIGMPVAALYIEFPNGTREGIPAVVRHVRVADRNAHAYVGFSFPSENGARNDTLPHWLREVEREIAFRSGQGYSHLMQPSQLFIGGPSSPVEIRLNRTELGAKAARTPMVAELRGIANTLASTVIALRNRYALPEDRIAEAADRLCELLAEDRSALLYALCCLPEQPPLLQHCIAMAGRLADLVQAETLFSDHVRDITIAALIHDLGNTAAAGPQTATNDTMITDPAAPGGHHTALLEALTPAGSWVQAGIRKAVIEIANDPNQSPTSAPAGSVVESLARAARIVDAIDIEARGVGGRELKPMLNIFRSLFQASDEADQHWIKRYMQRQGIYPVGTLVRFSNGFAAWVMRLGEDGKPAQVRVVKNLNDRQLGYDQVLERSDFGQIGEIERPVLPHRYGLTPH